MSIVFHVVAAAAVAHVASARLRDQSHGGFRRPGLALLAFAAVIGLASHGVLDGLRHGYPIPAVPDIVAGSILAAAWCFAVRPPLRLLFAAVIARHIFPWHWPEGSGSLHAGGNDAARSLDFGGNRAVSLTNHVIIVLMAAGCVLTNPWAFRFAGREESR